MAKVTTKRRRAPSAHELEPTKKKVRIDEKKIFIEPKPADVEKVLPALGIDTLRKIKIITKFLLFIQVKFFIVKLNDFVHCREKVRRTS